MSLSAEEKKQAIRNLYEMSFNARNLDYLDEAFGGAYMDYSPGGSGPMDREGFKQFFNMYVQAFPDLRLEIVGDIVAEGDYVAWRDVSTGTHQNDFMGIPATGKQIRIEGVHIAQFNEDGTAKAHWGSIDNLGMLQQLGVIPEMGAQPALA
jgi:steroid delta-isomerase-like uncharacterized protein